MEELKQFVPPPQPHLLRGQRPLSLYLRQADESTFYNANVLLPSQQIQGSAAAVKRLLVGLPISKDITMTQQKHSQDETQLVIVSKQNTRKQIDERQSFPITNEENDLPLATQTGEESKMSHTASELVSKQLARLNTERQESHFMRQKHHNRQTSSDDDDATIVQDLLDNDTIEQHLTPLQCIKHCLNKDQQGKSDGDQAQRRSQLLDQI